MICPFLEELEKAHFCSAGPSCTVNRLQSSFTLALRKHLSNERTEARVKQSVSFGLVNLNRILTLEKKKTVFSLFQIVQIQEG